MYTRKDNYYGVTTGLDIMSMCGYEQKTTAWDDFSIADYFGKKAIEDTYKSLLKFCGNDYVYLTELSIILNHKLWQHYNNGFESLARLYDKLWKKHHNWCCTNFKGDALSYYYTTTD